MLRELYRYLTNSPYFCSIIYCVVLKTAIHNERTATLYIKINT